LSDAEHASKQRCHCSEGPDVHTYAWHAGPAELTCTCVIRLAPQSATTSIWGCAEHGDPEALEPQLGQVLRYCVLIGQNSTHTAVGPISSAAGIEQARYYADRLNYTVHGVYSMTSFGDLEAAAQKRGIGGDAPPPQTSHKQLPKGLLPQNAHEPGCMYADTDHPGKCYIVKRPIKDSPQA
jgi:hypothetical protein